MTPDTLARVLDALGDRADAPHWRTLARLLQRSTDARRDLDAARRRADDLEQRLTHAWAADRNAAIRAIREGDDLDGVTETAPAIEAELRAARQPLDCLQQAAADADAAMRRHVADNRDAMRADLAATFDDACEGINRYGDALREGVEVAATMRAMYRSLDQRGSAGFHFVHPKHLNVMVQRGPHRVEVTGTDLATAATVLPFAEQIK